MALNLNLNLPVGTHTREEDLGEGFNNTYEITVTTPNQPSVTCEVKIETKHDEGSAYQPCGTLINESRGISKTTVQVGRFVRVTMTVDGGDAILNIRGN
jgi:hypothetical protein